MVKVEKGQEINPLNASLRPDRSPLQGELKEPSISQMFDASMSPALRAMYASDRVSSLAAASYGGQSEPLRILAELEKLSPALLAPLTPQFAEFFKQTGLERVKAGVLALAAKVASVDEMPLVMNMARRGLRDGLSVLQKAALDVFRNHPDKDMIQPLLDYVRNQRRPDLQDAGNRAVEAALALR